MNLLKNIGGRLWAFWAMIVFASTLLVVVIPICLTYLVKEPAGTELFRRISKAWMMVFLNLAGCPLKVKGKEHFKKGKTYVVVCNHNSLMDVPITTPFIPGANKTIAKKSMSKIPLFGWIYTRGSVLVDRNSDESRRRSFEEMKRTLAMGLHMVVYPEGTRNKTADPLKSFYDGAFKLAADAKKDVIPALLFNTKKVLPAGKVFFLWPRRIEMHFLPAVETQGLTSKQIREKTFNLMWNYYLENAK